MDVKLIAATQADLARAGRGGGGSAPTSTTASPWSCWPSPRSASGATTWRRLAAHVARVATPPHTATAPKRLDAAAAAWLAPYRWPGNVRELRHLMERVTLLH